MKKEPVLNRQVCFGFQECQYPEMKEILIQKA